MARVELPVVVMNPTTGLPVNGASIAISQRSNAAAVTWWTAETGGSSSTAAVVTDANGRGTAWVARGAYNLTISGSGITTYVEPWDAIPASDLGGDTLWLPDLAVTNAKVASGLDAAKLTTGTLPASAYGAGSIPGTALVAGSVDATKMAAGTGSRLLGVYSLTSFIVSSTTQTILTNTGVTHNNKATTAVLIHNFRGTGTMTLTPRLYLDATIVASSAYAVTNGEMGMMSIVYTSAALSGSHTWFVDVTGTAVGAVGGGTGLLLLFEQY